MTVEIILKEYLTNGIRDFWDDEYEIYKSMNSKEESLTDRLKSLLGKLSIAGSDFEYSIATEEEYTANKDIYINAISAVRWDEGEMETIIITGINYVENRG